MDAFGVECVTRLPNTLSILKTSSILAYTSSYNFAYKTFSRPFLSCPDLLQLCMVFIHGVSPLFKFIQVLGPVTAVGYLNVDRSLSLLSLFLITLLYTRSILHQ